MITEDYVSFEIAKLLKEKGFDAECHSHYYPCHYPDGSIQYHKYERTEYEKDKPYYAIYSLKTLPTDHYLAPTLQMALKWLRKKGFHIFVPMEIDYDEDERGDKWYHNATYYPEIRRVSDGKIMYDDGSLYAEPEHAYEVAIKYCLENLI